MRLPIDGQLERTIKAFCANNGVGIYKFCQGVLEDYFRLPQRGAVWLYRVLESDEADDPLDFGIVRADNVEEAVGHVSRRLRQVLGSGSHQVKFYPLLDVGYGVLPDGGEAVIQTVDA